MSSKETTQVSEKQLPPVRTQILNAPKTMEAAIQRIMAVEMALEDLARAAELSQITGNPDMMTSFIATANEALTNRITFEHLTSDVKITVIES